MTREIKFRAWDRDNGKMVYRFFAIDNTSGMAYGGEINTDLPYILMQFTGLKDKNGNDIYEGDIVKDNLNGNIRTLQWTEGDMEPFGHYYDDPRDWEIIGNIYESPDLLNHPEK